MLEIRAIGFFWAVFSFKFVVLAQGGGGVGGGGGGGVFPLVRNDSVSLKVLREMGVFFKENTLLGLVSVSVG